MTIVLDHTLEDLYSRDGDTTNLVFVFAYPASYSQSPSPQKFTYQTPLESQLNQNLIDLLHLHDLPLRLSFVVGNLPLVMLDLESIGAKGALRPYKTDAIEVLGQLHHGQRPDLSFISDFSNIMLQPGTKVVVLNPSDSTSHLPHLIDPETHYELLSKRWLAHSGLPTPETSIIEPAGTGGISSPEYLDRETERMVRPIYERDLPFVVKMPQARGGLGTFIVRTESERHKVGAVLPGEVRNMLEAINPRNRHLRPCSLIIQEFVPGECVSLSLFVTQKGRAIFICCSSQLFDEHAVWCGGGLSYAEQPGLEKRYAAIADQVARLLHSKRYYGPVGADILTDPDGRQLVIDLNVRITGSYNLGCLRGHFERRSLLYSSLSSFHLYCTQRDFRRHFASQIQDGSMIVSSWTSGFPDGSSLVSITMAAPDHDLLKERFARVDAFASETKHSNV